MKNLCKSPPGHSYHLTTEELLHIQKNPKLHTSLKIHGLYVKISLTQEAQTASTIQSCEDWADLFLPIQTQTAPPVQSGAEMYSGISSAYW